MTLTLSGANFAAWTTTTAFTISNNALSQAQVDDILRNGHYAAFATRTVSGGALAIGGTNAAPSGVLAAMCPPTTGKAAAYELVNDSCSVNPTKKWTSVTITT